MDYYVHPSQVKVHCNFSGDILKECGNYNRLISSSSHVIISETLSNTERSSDKDSKGRDNKHFSCIFYIANQLVNFCLNRCIELYDRHYRYANISNSSRFYFSFRISIRFPDRLELHKVHGRSHPTEMGQRNVIVVRLAVFLTQFFPWGADIILDMN